MAGDKVLVLVEFDDGGTLRKAGKYDVNPAELAHLSQRSREAVENALNTIDWIAKKAHMLIGTADDSPDEVELEFGIEITAKAGMLVVQADSKFHIKAKVIWKKDKNG